MNAVGKDGVVDATVSEPTAPVHPRIPARMVLIVGSLSIFGALCIDVYLPALPAIGRDLHASASEVEASLSGCVLGLGIGQLVIGPLSDRFGRRRPLLIGLLFFVLASAGLVFAPNAVALIGLRFVQGLAAAAGLVTGRAIVRDQYTGLTAVRFFSLLILVTGLGPILAPQIGAGLLHFGSWRLMFVALVVGGAILLTTSYFLLPETLPPEARRASGIASTFRSLREVGSSRNFLVNALGVGLAFGVLLAYIAGSSFALENVYGLSPQEFSLAFAGNGVGLVAASQVNGRLVRYVSSYRLMTGGLIGLAVSGIALVVVVSTGFLGLTGVLICTFSTLSSNGFVGPNAQALALNDFPHAAGTASALLGVLQFAIGGLVAPLVGLGGPNNALPMAIVMASLGVSAVVVRIALRKRPARPQSPAPLIAREVLDPS